MWARRADAFDELHEAVHQVMRADAPLSLASGMRSAAELVRWMLSSEAERSA